MAKTLQKKTNLRECDQGVPLENNLQSVICNIILTFDI